jgi:acetyl esterase/lipase
VNGALRWTRAHADELGIDRDKIVVQGHSAGAHLALMAAGTPGHPAFDPDAATQGPAGPIAAVVAYYPPVQLVAGRAIPDPSAPPGPEMFKALRGDDGTGPAAMLLGPSATEEEAAAVSPINYVKAGFPPTLIFHGTDDMLVAPVASLNLHHKLRAAGVPSEVHLIAGANHEFDMTPSLGEVCVAATTSFLSRYVIDPKGFVDEVMRTNPMAAMAALANG